MAAILPDQEPGKTGMFDFPLDSGFTMQSGMATKKTGANFTLAGGTTPVKVPPVDP